MINAPIFPDARREVVVGAGRAALFSVHPLKRAGRDEPIVQRLSPDAQRVGEGLVGAGPEAVE